MKINFDWHGYMSKSDKTKNIQETEGFLNHKNQIQGNRFLNQDAVVEFGKNLQQEYGLEGFVEGINSEDYLAVQRDFMTVMSNSMSVSDFQKMKEEGFDVSSMEPEQAVTILDKIKTVLAQSGMQIDGYNDDLSVEQITEITGNSGYAEIIAKELSHADVPVTKENMEEIHKVVERALQQGQPEESSIIYMIRNQMNPSLSNLYKAEHSSLAGGESAQRIGYVSNGYSRYGTSLPQARRTSLSEADCRQIEQQMKNRMEQDGLEADSDTLEAGKWLLEKGLPVNGKNLELLQEIKNLPYPPEVKRVIRQAANAIGEGKSPFQVSLSGTEKSVYAKAVEIYQRYQNVTLEAADGLAAEDKVCNLKNLENFVPQTGAAIPQIEARKTLEEVRLKMTVEANVRLLKSGYSIETAPMEDLIQKLEEAQKSLNESIFGKQNTQYKSELFSKTQSYLKELPLLPIDVIGKIPSMEKAAITNIAEEGRIQQKQYEQANRTYETVMTSPRADLGDSIKKAFRNADDILKDLDLEINEANRRAIRIMGYNRITITEDNLEKIKKADQQVRNVIEKLKPAMTLALIREGKNPLEMSLDELQEYIRSQENDFINDSQKYSEFLYKLEKKKDITQAEREAYIGIYRLIRQIEKSDGAVIGSLINQNAGLNLSNLLSSVRSRNARHMDLRVDNTIGMVVETRRKGVSISEQIENGIAEIQNNMISAQITKQPEELIKETEELRKEEVLKRELLQAQVEELRESIGFEGKEKEYLELYRQPVTLENLQSVKVLNENRGRTFKKACTLEQELSQKEMEEAEETILKDAEEFISSMEEEEKRSGSYEKMILHTRQVLSETLESKKLDYAGIKELQSMYKQISVVSSLSKEENYEIPVQIGEEITSVNLKILHKSQSAEVKITMETENYGKVEARFTQTLNGLEGSVLTDYMDGKNVLEAGSDRLKNAIEEALKETEIELKNIFFGTKESLNLNAIESRGEEGLNVSLLYKVAKEFIYYIKEV